MQAFRRIDNVKQLIAEHEIVRKNLRSIVTIKERWALKRGFDGLRVRGSNPEAPGKILGLIVSKVLMRQKLKVFSEIQTYATNFKVMEKEQQIFT